MAVVFPRLWSFFVTMSLLKSLQIAHLPPSLVVHIALYRDVKNSSFLREQLISANSAYEYAFIDASMVWC